MRTPSRRSSWTMRCCSPRGCEIVIPALISRATEFSTNERFGVKTNVPAPRVDLPSGVTSSAATSSATRCRRCFRWWTGSSAQPEQAAGARRRTRRGRHASRSVCGALDDPHRLASMSAATSARARACGRNRSTAMSSACCVILAMPRSPRLIAPRPLVIQHLGFPNRRRSACGQARAARHRRAGKNHRAAI